MKTIARRNLTATAVGLVLILAVTAPGAEREVELLQNGGFKQGTSAWSGQGGAELSDLEARTGKRSVRLTAGQRVLFGTRLLEQGQLYRADAWIKVRNASGERKVAPLLVVEQQGSYSSAGNHDWERVSHLHKAARSGPVQVCVICPEGMRGEVYADDLSFRPCEDPHLKALDFEDGSTLGVVFYHEPRPIYRVVEGATPNGKRYLAMSPGTSAAYVLSQPVTRGDTEFDFTFKSEKTFRVSLGGAGFSLEMIPRLRIVQGEGGAVSMGTINPGSWCRVRGVIHLDQHTLDLQVTDFDDPLGSFEKKDAQMRQEKLGVTNVWFNSADKGETCLDAIYIGPVRRKYGPIH